MKKKVIGSSILLLVLLLGLSTTCYALSWETVRDTLNNYTGNNIGVARFKLALNNTTQYNKLVNNWDISSYDTIIYQSMETRTNDYSNDRLIICNNNGKIYKQNNEQIVRSVGNFDCLNSKIYSINQNVNELMYVYGSITDSFFLVNSAYNRNFILTNGEIYNSSNLNSPATTIEIIGMAPPTYFEFDMNSYQSTQYVDLTFLGDDGLTYNYNDIPIYYKPNDTSQVYIGTLLNTGFTSLTNDNFAVIYWKNNKWNARSILSRDLNIYAMSSPYLSVTPNNDLTSYEYGQLPRFNVRDCFYFYSIDNNENERAIALWYIGSSHTIISGDKIDPSTFNDYPDYDDNVKSVFNNIDDIDNISAATEPILDTLTDDEQVSGELAGLISGDATDIASRFGYSPVENPFTTVILDVMTDMTDILLGSGDQTLNFGFGGKNIIVHSSDFVLPTNRITTFLHLLVNGFFIWGIYKYGFTLYQWINSGRLQNLVNEANRHQYYLF